MASGVDIVDFQPLLLAIEKANANAQHAEERVLQSISSELKTGPNLCADDLSKKMEETQKSASDIERQLDEARAHLKRLREHVTSNESEYQKAEFQSIQELQHQFQQLLHHSALAAAHTVSTNQKVDIATPGTSSGCQLDEIKQCFEQILWQFKAADELFSKLDEKIATVQSELQISWLSLTTLQLEFNSKRDSYEQHEADARGAFDRLKLNNSKVDRERLEAFLDLKPSLQRMETQLANNNELLQRLSGSHERLRHALVETREEVKLRKEVVIGKFKTACVQFNALKRVEDGFQQEVSKTMDMLSELRDWCSQVETKTNDECLAIKLIRTELAATASELLELIDLDSQIALIKANFQNSTISSDDILQDMSKRIENLVEEIKLQNEQPDESCTEIETSVVHYVEEVVTPKPESEESKALAVHIPNDRTAASVEKRLTTKGFDVDVNYQEEEFLRKKKMFLNGLHESFKRVRQRETVCISLDKRLMKAKSLLEQAQRGFSSSEYVTMKSKRQIEQAYKELIHVQQEIDSIKALSYEVVAADTLPPLLIEGENEELELQKKLNQELKQQVVSVSLQARNAEQLLAMEKHEVDNLRRQVQGISEKLKLEARSLNETQNAALRAREAVIERLREKLNEAGIVDWKCKHEEAIERIDELMREKEMLLSNIDKQDLDMVRLKNENVCLVVEKIAFEGSARALQDKMSRFMAKLSQTKSQWKSFVVYCEAF